MNGGRRGYLVIADITGYTRFLTGSELEHAQGILEGLFEALIERLKSPLVLSHIQGDAVLAHAPAEQVPEGGLVFDSVEGLYIGFRERLAHMERNTTCPCAACANMPELDLKLVVHFGTYIEHDLGGHRELSGPDVILAHRLLKNSVREETGIAAYALFTEAAIAEIGLEAPFANAPHYALQDQDLGTIKTRVHDLSPGWRRHQEQSRVIVGPDAKLFVPEINHAFEAPPDVMWHYLLDPLQRPRWFVDVVKLDREKTESGRLAAGAHDHCAHGGGQVSVNIFVDVLPHHHATYDIVLPMGGTARVSMILQSRGAGTDLTIRSAQATAPDAIRATWLRLISKTFFAKKVAEDWRRSLENLDALVAAEVPPRNPDAAALPPTDAFTDLARRTLSGQESQTS